LNMKQNVMIIRQHIHAKRAHIMIQSLLALEKYGIRVQWVYLHRRDG